MFGGADASTRAFASKLSRKLKWKTAFALRVIGEYKKFVYLGVVSSSPVTPSKVIDQVWHEHLLFTKAYRDFCKEVIGQDFDHAPELIPIEDQTLIFNDQYLDTLALYNTEFNAEPPADIWAVPKFDRILPKRESSKTDPSNRSSVMSGRSGSSYIYDDEPIYLLVDSATNDLDVSSGFQELGGGDSCAESATESEASGTSSSTPSCSSSSGSSCSSGSSSSCGSD